MQDDEIRCVVLIDGLEVVANLLHMRRDKFKVLSDDQGGKYVGRIIDAEDVLRSYL